MAQQALCRRSCLRQRAHFHIRRTTKHHSSPFQNPCFSTEKRDFSGHPFGGFDHIRCKTLQKDRLCVAVGSGRHRAASICTERRRESAGLPGQRTVFSSKSLLDRMKMPDLRLCIVQGAIKKHRVYSHRILFAVLPQFGLVGQLCNRLTL